MSCWASRSPHPKTIAARYVAAGFGFLIGGGTLLLSLPVARAPETACSLLSSLFTATSIICVVRLVIKEFGVCKLTADRPLTQFTVRQLYDQKKVTVLVMHHGNRVIMEPPDSHEIAEGDTLVIAGRDEHLRALTEMARP